MSTSRRARASSRRGALARAPRTRARSPRDGTRARAAAGPAQDDLQQQQSWRSGDRPTSSSRPTTQSLDANGPTLLALSRSDGRRSTTPSPSPSPSPSRSLPSSTSRARVSWCCATRRTRRVRCCCSGRRWPSVLLSRNKVGMNNLVGLVVQSQPTRVAALIVLSYFQLRMGGCSP
jgi:hypothetical protein